MSVSTITYDPSAAVRVFGKNPVETAAPAMVAARDEIAKDVALFEAGGDVPAEKQPLDAGFVNLPAQLLADHEANGDASLVGRLTATAAELRDQLDRFVVLGIGGSYMGARALFEALGHRYHNELDRAARKDVPRIYFEGNNVDSDTLSGLLDLLPTSGGASASVEDRWGLTVISKSGGTLETAISFRLFRDALESFYGSDSDEAKRFVVPVTGEVGRLRDLSNNKGYPAVFPIPDGVGGRFSVLTAVGLLPAAVLGFDVPALLRGAADMTERFRTADPGDNPVLDYTAVCHVAEGEHGMTNRLLSTWGARLEALGLWYDQLLAESLGKQQLGAFPLTVVNTRDLHSRGQQHQEGRRDKLITNVVVDRPTRDPLAIPEAADDADRLNALAGKTVADVLDAATKGTNQAYADDNRPTADLRVPVLDEYAMGQLFQMFMLATVLEGRVIAVNPYGQPGVEAYKQNTNAILRG